MHNGDRYEGIFLIIGFFQDDLMHGYGEYFYVNGGKYSGDFYEGMR